MNWEEQLGIKLSATVAGVIGGLVSLTFEQKLSFFRAVLLLFSGGVTAGFTAPITVEHLGFTPNWGGAIAFTIGLFAMRIISVLMRILDMVKENPSILLSMSKFLALLKNDSNNSSSSRNRSDDKSSVHSTREDNKGD